MGELQASHLEYYLPTKFGIDKRIAHFSSLMLSGDMTREEAMAMQTLRSLGVVAVGVLLISACGVGKPVRSRAWVFWPSASAAVQP